MNKGEAIKILKDFHDESALFSVRTALETLYPEFKESEDEKIRKSLTILLQHFCKGYRVPGLDFPVSYKEILAWLEKQGEKEPTIEMKTPEESLGIDSDTYNEIVDECIYGEQKPAWSEEDEKMVDNILTPLATRYPFDIYQPMYNWLKSLKDRVQPQNTWKPSDEQMADLWNMLCECRPADHQLLQDIYYGLKKLRENNL